MMKKVIYIFCAVFIFLNLVACNTVEGFGKDVEKIGDKIQRKADK